MPSSAQFCTSSDTATFKIEHSIANSSTPFNSASWCEVPSATRALIRPSIDCAAR